MRIASRILFHFSFVLNCRECRISGGMDVFLDFHKVEGL